MFYGWKVGLVSLSGNFMLQGCVTYIMNAFMEPLCEANGWSRGQINLGMGLAVLAGQIAMPVMASLSARFSLRILMVSGALTGGVATFFLGFSGNIWTFTALYTISCVATQACGGVVGNALVSNWFCRYRGRAFGLVNTGTSFSGAVLPLLALPLIQAFGIRDAYMAFGAATLLLAPLSWLIVRDSPEAMGLQPDGNASRPQEPHALPDRNVFSHMAHNPKAYALGLAFGLALLVASGVLSQLKPRFADVGLEAYPAMLLACMSALFAAFAKYAWGAVCDRFTPITATRAVMLLSFASLALGFLPPTRPGLILFCIAFGSCAGGLWTILPAVTSHCFGGDNFLPAYKFVSLFILLRCLGFPIMGFAHDLSGSYAPADVIFLIFLLISFALTFVASGRAEPDHNTSRA
ncbi:MAG: MFS transporter [Desulfovibrio sp.]|jgi:nitrate/nitrite transporter NarK|nr:MFS transporter [Desulfovibrio sp.]